MAWRFVGLAWQAQGLTPAQKLVLLRLADAANDDGECWPSHRLIAKDTGLGERTVRRSVDELVAKKVLTRSERTRKDGGQTSNLYTINTPPGHSDHPPRSENPPPLATVTTPPGHRDHPILDPSVEPPRESSPSLSPHSPPAEVEARRLREQTAATIAREREAAKAPLRRPNSSKPSPEVARSALATLKSVLEGVSLRSGAPKRPAPSLGGG